MGLLSYLSWLFKGGKQVKKSAYSPGPGTYATDIVGESHYQKDLEDICGGRTKNSEKKFVNATLILEANNPHDKNAVRVDIHGKTVGHLNRGNARLYRKWIRMNDSVALKKSYPAMIVGGWRREGGFDNGHFGVKLDMPKEFHTHSDSNTASRKPKVWSLSTRRSEFTFSVYQPNMPEISEARNGESVNLWAPVDNPEKIIVFLRGTTGGEGKLGLVPFKYAHQIANQLISKRPIDAKISRITSSGCFIRCRLVSAEEVERKNKKKQQKLQEVERTRNEKQRKLREKLRVELPKPYRPYKPIMFFADVLSRAGSFKVGEELKLSKIPSIDEFIAHPMKATLIFKSIDGRKTVVKRNELPIKKKIIRLANTFDDLEFRVISIPEKEWDMLANTSDDKKSLQIKLQFVPQKIKSRTPKSF